MGVILNQSASLPGETAWTHWLAVTGAAATDLPASRRLPDVPARLEAAFVAGREIWWRLGRTLFAEPTGNITHATACASVGSDFGIMIAWTLLVRDLAEQDETTLVVCDDPWLFRELAALPGVRAGRAPGLLAANLRRRFRGVMARLRTALRLAAAVWKTRRFRAQVAGSKAAILVYGHPSSDANGNDAYFNGLLQHLPDLARLLHTDCPPQRAEALCADGRSASLHAWGSPLFALAVLPFTRWRPGRDVLAAPYGWIVRRAAAMENSGGGPAMNRWQMHCQRRWIKAEAPANVAWPWENFAWERALVGTARANGVRTLGYQHTVVGPHQFNYSVQANPDGLDSIPDVVIANGPAYGQELRAWGIPAARLIDAGCFRFKPGKGPVYDPDAPVFVALSGNLKIVPQQMAVAERLAASGRRVIVKEHPMYPVRFEESELLSHTSTHMAEQTALSAVLYTTGASGLDAVLAGIPCIRLQLADQISINTLPAFSTALTADADTVVSVLDSAKAPEPADWHRIFSVPDIARWRLLLNGAPISSI